MWNTDIMFITLVSQFFISVDSGAVEAVAQYQYVAQESGDLEFNVGDVIMVTKRDTSWWTGSLHGK